MTDSSSIHNDGFVRVRRGVEPYGGRRLRVEGWGDGKRFVHLRVPRASGSHRDYNVLGYDADEVERIKRVRDRVVRK